MIVRLALVAFIALALPACSGRIVPPSASSPAPVVKVPPPIVTVKPRALPPASAAASVAYSGPNARKAGVTAGPDFAALKFDDAGADRALKTFRASCPALLRRNDQSGLTNASDWQAPCSAAAGWSNDDARGFFENQFDVVQVGDGKSFATGYYEPEIAGSRVRSAGYDVPVYKRPSDLIEVDLGKFNADLKDKKIRGRVQGSTFVPYPDRAAIEAGALAGRGLELAYAASAVDFFVLQVQGSGRLKLPDGSVMRIAYDSQNGRDYTGIGRLMRDRGLLAPGKATMGDIVDYINANPAEGAAIMRENKSWVFFRELTGPGPIGSLNIPIVARGSVATDPAFIPLGAPVVLTMDRAEASGLWIAQDTGGAIKGSNRFDTFWGAGDEAARIAGGMSARGTAFVLLPRGVLTRITNATPTP